MILSRHTFVVMKLTHLPQVIPVTWILAVALLRPPDPLGLAPLVSPAPGVITEAVNLAGLHAATCPEHQSLVTDHKML